MSSTLWKQARQLSTNDTVDMDGTMSIIRTVWRASDTTRYAWIYEIWVMHPVEMGRGHDGDDWILKEKGSQDT